MNSPYQGKFCISQRYKGSAHDGLDLVGIDSKELHSTVNGVVIYAGWENAGNHAQGFGRYVKIKKSGTDEVYYFGHLSSIRVAVGQTVRVTDVIGVEGSTGSSTGSHCHYCMRIGGVRGQHRDISVIAKIPNVEGDTYDDGYRGAGSSPTTQSITIKGNGQYYVRKGAGTGYAVTGAIVKTGETYDYDQTSGGWYHLIGKGWVGAAAFR